MVCVFCREFLVLDGGWTFPASTAPLGHRPEAVDKARDKHRTRAEMRQVRGDTDAAGFCVTGF